MLWQKFLLTDFIARCFQLTFSKDYLEKKTKIQWKDDWKAYFCAGLWAPKQSETLIIMPAAQPSEESCLSGYSSKWSPGKNWEGAGMEDPQFQGSPKWVGCLWNLKSIQIMGPSCPNEEFLSKRSSTDSSLTVADLVANWHQSLYNSWAIYLCISNQEQSNMICVPIAFVGLLTEL